jgi:membrane protease YdiL (CAAX protease family)
VNPLSVLVFERLGYPTDSTVQQPLMRGLQGFVGENPGLAIPAIVLVVVVLGPTVEELVFRGAIFNGLRRLNGWISGSLAGSKGRGTRAQTTARRVSFALSALVSSAVFALLHLEPVLLPALLLLAVALCYLFEKTESLLPPIVAHATFNSFATSIIILSGLGVFELPV